MTNPVIIFFIWDLNRLANQQTLFWDWKTQPNKELIESKTSEAANYLPELLCLAIVKVKSQKRRNLS